MDSEQALRRIWRSTTITNAISSSLLCEAYPGCMSRTIFNLDTNIKPYEHTNTTIRLPLLMPKRRLNPLPLMFMLLLPLLGVLPPEAMLEDFTNRLKRHALDIRVEEDDEQPADEADAAVEAEGS